MHASRLQWDCQQLRRNRLRNLIISPIRPGRAGSRASRYLDLHTSLKPVLRQKLLIFHLHPPPLPFVPLEAPIYLKGKSRRGPTFRESILMHAVARLALNRQITNIQTSWVKLGEKGTQMCLKAGANDLGGTLMNETITRSAGATHGEEKTPHALEAIIQDAGRIARQRTTLYKKAPKGQRTNSYNPEQLVRIINSQVKRNPPKKQAASRQEKIDTLDVYAQTMFINSMF